jgi:ketosteroid isomerase-like protein
MKSLLIILFTLAQITSYAQSSSTKALEAAVDQLRKGMLDGDRVILESVTASDLTYGHSSGKIEDRKTFIESLVTRKSDFVTLDLSEQTIVVKGNTAIVRHRLTAQTNDDGNPGNANIGVMQVWMKEKGSWKLLGRQAFKIISN